MSDEATIHGPGEGERIGGAMSVTVNATSDFNTPSGWENYMRDLGELLARDTPPRPEEIGRIASRYDFNVAK